VALWDEKKICVPRRYSTLHTLIEETASHNSACNAKFLGPSLICQNQSIISSEFAL